MNKDNVFDNLSQEDLASIVQVIEDSARKANARILSRNLHPNDLSEAGAAESFSKLYSEKLHWTKALGWMCWNGRQWVQSDEKAKAAMITYSNDLLTDAKNEMAESIRQSETGDPSKEAKEYLRFAQRMRNSKPIENILSLAKAYLAMDTAVFDANPYDLNTPSGIVDLRTGQIRGHDPLAYCSKMTACAPSAKGLQLFESFLDTITGSNDEIKRYLQLSAGSYTIGKIFHEGIQIAIGGGRNGKSTYYNLLAAVLGDYSGSIDVNVLTTDRISKGAAKATLRGKRLVTCGELEEGQRLSTQTLKQLASTDMLTIEEKYRQPETITPSHHLVMFSNHLPRVGSTDDGTWRRIQLVPFSTTIEKKTDKPNYADYLFQNAGGAVLQWVITGAMDFIKNGCRLEPPEAVRKATDKYRDQENWLQNFFDECCMVKKTEAENTPSIFIGVGALYDAYKEYADRTGTYRRSMPDFNRAMETAGFIKRTVSGGYKHWQGIDLKNRLYMNPQGEQLKVEHDAL